jgi:alkanesulfonate monooxygenase SsuD/methylene tetrahydromethanopterin reductase-like flavin-dependent oxidoreductase (luciferase family)
LKHIEWVEENITDLEVPKNFVMTVFPHSSRSPSQELLKAAEGLGTPSLFVSEHHVIEKNSLLSSSFLSLSPTLFLHPSSLTYF